jgi:hypothetical protein
MCLSLLGRVEDQRWRCRRSRALIGREQCLRHAQVTGTPALFSTSGERLLST